MERARPSRRRLLRPNPFGMCRSKHSFANSFSLCRCKTTSYLHILHQLKVPYFQSFANLSGLTHLVCVDTKSTGGGGPALRCLALAAKEGRDIEHQERANCGLRSPNPAL